MTGIIAQNVGRTSGLIKAASGGGVWTLIKTLTSDGSDSDLSFVDGTDDVTFDSTYPIYLFTYINMHPETDAQEFKVQSSTDTGSTYGVTVTNTNWDAYHDEADSATALMYDGGGDNAQATRFIGLTASTGSDNDQSTSGHFRLFNPSSTVFVKHFISASIDCQGGGGDYLAHSMKAGYFNTTSAIDAIQFKFGSGEIQGGKIKLYGIKDS